MSTEVQCVIEEREQEHRHLPARDVVRRSEDRGRRRVEGGLGVAEHDARAHQTVDGVHPLGVVRIEVGETLILGLAEIDAGLRPRPDARNNAICERVTLASGANVSAVLPVVIP